MILPRLVLVSSLCVLVSLGVLGVDAWAQEGADADASGDVEASAEADVSGDEDIWGMEPSGDDDIWGMEVPQDGMAEEEDPSAKYLEGSNRLALGERRAFAVPDYWPKDLKPPNRRNNCLLCHLAVGGTYTQCTLDFAESRHDRERLSCDMCHGGDTTNDESSHTGTYIGTHPGESVARCTDCHWVSARIFEASPHYKAEYDWRFPRCYECHGEHAIGKGEIAMADACTSCHGARAVGQTGEGESAIIWKSPIEGDIGNEISITLQAGAPNAELSIEHHLNGEAAELIVHLATDGTGKSISLAEEIIEEISMSEDLLYVIYCEEGDGYLGEDIVEPTPRFTLEGGADFDVEYPEYSELIRATDAFWASLAQLNEQPDRVPPDFEEAVTVVKKRIMALAHASPKVPDPDEVESVVNSTRNLKERIDEFLQDL